MKDSPWQMPCKCKLIMKLPISTANRSILGVCSKLYLNIFAGDLFSWKRANVKQNRTSREFRTAQKTVHGYLRSQRFIPE